MWFVLTQEVLRSSHAIAACAIAASAAALRAAHSLAALHRDRVREGAQLQQPSAMTRSDMHYRCKIRAAA